MEAEIAQRGLPPAEPVASSKFQDFQSKYAYDPYGFVRDCIRFRDDEELAPYQAEILQKLPIEKRVGVRGPHGLGKTALASWVILWAILTADDVKVPTTASAWRQLSKYLWPEVHKWALRLDWDVIGRDPFKEGTEMLTLSLKRGAICEAFAVASNNPALIEGAHARRIVYVFDESKTVLDETFDAAEGAFSSAGEGTGFEAFALTISTPGEPIGRFYQIHRRAIGYEDWWVRHVTKDEAIAAGRMGKEWAAQRLRQWGEDSAVYQNRVLGEFAASGEDNIIPLPWVELANQRWREWDEAGRPDLAQQELMCMWEKVA